MALPPLPQPALQNNQGRWSQFFQSQGRGMPQPMQHNPALPPQAAPQASQMLAQHMPYQGGGDYRPQMMQQQFSPQMGQMPQQEQMGLPHAGQMPMAQMPPQLPTQAGQIPMGGQMMQQQAPLGNNFFRSRMGY